MPAPTLRRLFLLVAGWLAPLASVASMVWFGLFVAGLGVPKGIDDGPEVSRGIAIAVDLALVLSFAVVHSLLARRRTAARVAAFLRRAAGGSGADRPFEPLGRAGYSLLAAAQIGLLCALWRPLPAALWTVPSGPLRAAVWTAQAAGWAIVVAALAAIGRRGLGEFFGVAQARAAADGVDFQPAPLVARGVYARLRHPLYSGTALALVAAPTMSEGRALLVGSVILYLAIGSRFEERDLLARGGDSYRRYRDAVPAFLPSLTKGRSSE